MKKIIALMLALSMLLTACAFAGAEEETTVISIMWWGSQSRHDATTEMLHLYESTHPGIKFEMDYASWGDYWDVMAAKLQGGTMPDIMQNAYGSYITQYAEKGALEDLTPYIESGALNLDNCSAAVVSTGEVNGVLYGLPTGTNALTLMYDPAKVEDYDIPTFMTYSEYIELSKQLYEEKGYTETFVSAPGENQLRFWVRCHGIDVFADDGKSLGFEDASIVAELLELCADAVSEGWGLDPLKTLAIDGFNEIASGDSWVTLHWTNELNACEVGNGTELEMIAIPAYDDAERAATYFQPTMLWSVTSSSQHKDEAVEFINWFTNDLAGYEICGIDRGMPISSEILAALTPNFDAQNQKIAAIIGEFSEDGRSSAIYKSEPAAASEIYSMFKDYADKVRYGEITDYTAAAEEFMQKANDMLN